MDNINTNINNDELEKMNLNEKEIGMIIYDEYEKLM